MRITTVHDVFRSAVFGLPDPEESIGPWFLHLIGPHLTQLGHVVRRFSLMRDGTPKALIEAVEREGWPRDPSGWAYLFSDPRAENAVAELIAGLLDADLVIGFEMTPNMICVLSHAGARFLDLGQDPIRFCPDLFLRVRGNVPGLEAKLAAWEVPDAIVRTEAANLRTRIGTRDDGPRGVLFTGQMDIDSSLIAGATLTHVEPYLTRIEHHLGDRPLLLKPHPLKPKSQDLLTLYTHFPKARFIDDNIYALLAGSGIESVITLSSSVAMEAPFFGKSARPLIEPDSLTLPPDIVSRFYRIDARLASTAFWGDILHGMPSFMFIENQPPPLRQRFSVSWGYVRDMTARVPRGIDIDENVLFSAGARGPDCCLFGWSEPEPWGLWSDGPEALLQFVPPAGTSTLVAEIELAPFVPDPAHPPRVTICPRSADAGKIVSFVFPSDETVIVEVPIGASPEAEPVELLFRFPDAASPRQHGMSDDGRLLGVSLRRLTLRRVLRA